MNDLLGLALLISLPMAPAMWALSLWWGFGEREPAWLLAVWFVLLVISVLCIIIIGGCAAFDLLHPTLPFKVVSS